MQPHYIEFITVGLGILLLMFEAFSNGNKARLGLIGAVGLTIILMLQWTAPLDAEVPGWMAQFYIYDEVVRFYKTIALVSTILVLLMAVDFRKVLSKFTSGDASGSALGEFYCLPIFACAGLMWMASATNLVSIFVALELVTITFYVMVAFMRRNVGSLEAGVKYLILGALSTGFLVYGIAWMYGTVGTNFNDYGISGLANLTDYYSDHSAAPVLFAIALILIAMGFKVGAAPMQLWIPDVYQGAPTPITAYLSVASKAAGFIVLWKVVSPFIHWEVTGYHVTFMLAIMAGASLLYGNLAALGQGNFKRLLAYSSIAHAGFLLMGIAAADFNSVSFYLGTYLLMTFGAFFVLALVRCQTGSDSIDAFDGLSKRNPILAATLTIIMAALAGVPLTAGFTGKLLVFKAAIDSDVSIWLLIVAFIGVAAGFYYYLKVVKAMYWHAPRTEETIEVPIISKAVLVVLTAGILILGVYPKPLENISTIKQTEPVVQKLDMELPSSPPADH